MNDTESKLRQLLNQSIDNDLGPERPAPAFRQPASIPDRHRSRHLRRWGVPLLAGAAVAAALGATALVSRRTTDTTPVQPVISVAAPTSPGPATLAPSQSQLPPPESSPSPRRPSHASGSSAPAHSTSAGDQAAIRADNVMDFSGYGSIDLGLTDNEVATLEPTLTRNAFGASCVQFYDHAPTEVGGPMLNILLTPPTNRVIGITVPAAAVTDTGVRVGSTRTQIAAAYPHRHIVAMSSQGGIVVLVQGGTSWMGFLLDESGTVKSMSVGSKSFAAQQELCAAG